MIWLVCLGSADQPRMSCVVRDKTVHIMSHTQHTRLDISTETCLKDVGSCSPSEIWTKLSAWVQTVKPGRCVQSCDFVCTRKAKFVEVLEKLDLRILETLFDDGVTWLLSLVAALCPHTAVLNRCCSMTALFLCFTPPLSWAVSSCSLFLYEFLLYISCVRFFPHVVLLHYYVCGFFSVGL